MASPEFTRLGIQQLGVNYARLGEFQIALSNYYHEGKILN